MRIRRAHARRWPAVLAIVVAGCGGTPGDGQADATAASGSTSATQDRAGSSRSADHADVVVVRQPGSGPRDGDQGADQGSSRRSTRTSRSISLQGLQQPRQARSSRALASDNGAGRAEGNQGYQIDARAREGGADPPARQVRQGVRLEQVVGRPRRCRSSSGPRTASRSARARSGASRRPARTSGVFATRRSWQAGLSIPAARRSPTSTRCSPSCAAKLPASDPVIEFGNKEGYGTIHFMAASQGAYGAAQPIRDWIYHVPGSTFDTPGTVEALTKLRSGRTTATSTPTTTPSATTHAATQFAKGKGVFVLGGNWNAPIIKDGLGTERRRDSTCRPGRAGKHVGDRLGDRPVAHLGEDEERRPRGRVAELHHRADREPRTLVRHAADPGRRRRHRTPGDPFGRRSTTAWQQLVNDGGLTLYTDWASPSMFDTIATFQELLPGPVPGRPRRRRQRAKADQDDWSKFDEPARTLIGVAAPTGLDDAGARPPAIRRRRGAPRRRGRAARRASHATSPGCTSCRRLLVLPAVHVRAAAPHGVAVALRVGRPDGRHVGRPRQLHGGLPRPGRPRRRSGTRSILIVFYAVLPVVLGLLLTASMTRTRACAASAFFRDGAVPAADDRRRRHRAGVACGSTRRQGPLNAVLRAVGLGSLARGWLGDFTWALPAVGLDRHLGHVRALHGAVRRRRPEDPARRCTTPRASTAPGRCASSSRSRCRACATSSRSPSC